MAKETPEETIARLTAEKAELTKGKVAAEKLAEKLNQKLSEKEGEVKTGKPVFTPKGKDEKHVMLKPTFRLPGDTTVHNQQSLEKDEEIAKQLFAIEGQTICIPQAQFDAEQKAAIKATK